MQCWETLGFNKKSLKSEKQQLVWNFHGKRGGNWRKSENFGILLPNNLDYYNMLNPSVGIKSLRVPS